MIAIINQALNAVGSIPLMALPPGVGYWLTLFGVTALIGGIVSGISIALSIRIAFIFLKPARILLGL